MKLPQFVTCRCLQSSWCVRQRRSWRRRILLMSNYKGKYPHWRSFQSSSGNCFPLCLCSTSGDSTKTSRAYCGPPTGCSTPKLIYRCKKCPEAVYAQVFGDYSVLSSCRSVSWIFTLNTRKMVYSRPHIWAAAQILRVISHEALCQNSIWNPCGRLTLLTLWLLTLE